MKKIKSIVKMIIPQDIRHAIRRTALNFSGFERKYRGLDNQEIFDNIYLEGTWGKDESGNSLSGVGSHNREILEPYILATKKVLDDCKCESIADLGCGDFNIGMNFVDKVDKYYGCDVSEVILSRNHSKFNFPNVVWQKLDIASDQLPIADIGFVRQVLQHLSNDNICSFVSQLNKLKPFQYLLVTEHLPMAGDFTPNLDKPSGPDIRHVLGSGVELHHEPFNLMFKSMNVILEVNAQSEAGGSDIIRSTLYEL